MQPQLISQLEAISSWSTFARSLVEQAARKPLSDRQIAAAESMLAKVEQNNRERQERENNRPTVDISAIRKLFETATESKLKKPVFRAGDLQIETDREVGLATLWVRDVVSKAYLGKVEGSSFKAFRACKADTVATLEAVAADPTKSAIDYALKWKSCCCCGRTLTAAVSVVAVVGPICAKNWGLDYLRLAAAAAIKNGEV